MDERGRAMVMSSFVADSLALGAHWVYDTEHISRVFGRVDSFLKPGRDSYHATKEKGDFTHYGDQTFVLLKSVAERKGFDLHDFSARWQALFDHYDGYIDQATRGTLSNYKAGRKAGEAGSASDDLAGASRIAPLVYCFRYDDVDTLVKSARAQTGMTHNSAKTMDSAEFFSRVAWLALRDVSPIRAMERVSKEHFGDSPISQWLEAALESKHEKSVQAIARFGQTCHTEEAFPGVVHLIAKYENDLKEGLIHSVMAGGDSAARGMMVGMVLGAHLGPESLPQEWISQLRKEGEILKLLAMVA
jgi:ADP-ribosylglycohydrolase